jgi:hypothetical protein
MIFTAKTMLWNFFFLFVILDDFDVGFYILFKKKEIFLFFYLKLIFLMF